MKAINIKNTIGKGFLVISLLFGIGVATSATAQAQWRDRDNDQYRREQRRRDRRNDNYGGYNNGSNNGDRRNDGYRNYGGSFDLRQTALNAGANDGVKEGRKDRQRNERFDYTDEDNYRKATHDYSSRLGDRYIYQQYYRDAFVTGYTEGYRGY